MLSGKRMELRKGNTGGLVSETDIKLPVFRDGRRTAAACTSCGDRRMKWNRTPRAARTTGRWKKGADPPAHILGRRGGGAIWEASAETLFWNLSIPPVPGDITPPWALRKNIPSCPLLAPAPPS